MSALEEIFELATMKLKGGMVAQTYPKHRRYTITDPKSGTTAHVGVGAQKVRSLGTNRTTDVSGKSVTDKQKEDVLRRHDYKSRKRKIDIANKDGEMNPVAPKRAGGKGVFSSKPKGLVGGGTRIFNVLGQHMKQTFKKGRPVSYHSTVVNPDILKNARDFKKKHPKYAPQLDGLEGSRAAGFDFLRPTRVRRVRPASAADILGYNNRRRA